MININNQLSFEEKDCKMLLQVHDELIFEIKKSKIDKYIKMITKEMEKALEPLFQLDVPLVVDSNYGANWNEAH